jgi:hypothetical protein
MQNKIVSDWLGSDRNVQVGLEILKQFEPGSVTVTFVEQYAHLNFAKNKLEAALLAYLHTDTKITAVAEPEKKAVSVFKNYGRNDQSIDDKIKPIVEQAKQTYKEMAALHQQCYAHYSAATSVHKNDIQKINDYMAKHNMPVMVNQICDLDDKFYELCDTIDYYNKHKRLPADDVVIEVALPESEAELIKQLARVRQWISKNKNKPNKATELIGMTALKTQLENKLQQY